MLRIQNVYRIMTLILLIALCVSPALGQRRGASDVCPPESGGECGEGLSCIATCPFGWVLSSNNDSLGWNKYCFCKKKGSSQIGSCYKKNKKPIKCVRGVNPNGLEYTPQMLEREAKKCEKELNEFAALDYSRCLASASQIAAGCLQQQKSRKVCDKVYDDAKQACEEDRDAAEQVNKARCERIWLTNYENAGFCREHDYVGMSEEDKFYDAPQDSTCSASGGSNSGYSQDYADFVAVE